MRSIEQLPLDLLETTSEAVAEDGRSAVIDLWHDTWDEDEPEIPRVSSTSISALSPGQRRLWLLDQLAPGQAIHNVPFSLLLLGELSHAALDKAISYVIDRHSILRTRITIDALGEPGQETLAGEFSLSHVDLTSHPDAANTARSWAENDARTPVSIDLRIPWRAALLSVSAKESWLVFCFHHILIDGWSIGILLDDLRSAYRSARRDSKPEWPDLPIAYTDYAAWQHQQANSPRAARELDYWRNQLDGLPPIDLPSDHPRPALQSFHGAVHNFELAADISRSIYTASRTEGCTPFMVLLGAFYALLSRYTGSVDIGVGSPIASRERPEVAGLIGFFVNTLVLRVELSEEPTFKELLTRVRATCLAAYENQGVAFERVVEAIQPERDLSRPPLFQTLVSVQHSAVQSVAWDGLTVEYLPLHTATSKLDLNLTVELGADPFQAAAAVLEYNTDLFEPATIDRLAGHFTTLLRSALASPQTKISDLTLMSATEIETIKGLNEATAWESQVTPTSSVVSAFETQARLHANDLAVRCGQATLTYEQLDQAANRLAHRLVGAGAKAETRIGLLLDRSNTLAIAILATLKTGAAYVPLDPCYPVGRLRSMAQDAELDLLLLDSLLLDGSETLGMPADHVLDLSDLTAVCTGQPGNSVKREILPNQLAYITYTSGSTGQPKGVMVTHEGLRNYLSWATLAYNATKGTGALVHTSLSFDLTVTGLYLPWLSGKTVRFIPAGSDLDDLADALRESSDLTLVKLTPSHLEALQQRLDGANLRGCVKTLVIGGESLLQSTLAWWREHAPGTRLINEYGPTETVVGCCVHEATDIEPGIAAAIGKPIAGMQMHVLDAHLQRVPFGIPGELYIGGLGLARGYRARVEETAERFLPDPFASISGSRIYRTGDQVRYRDDGNLEFLGRVDQQIKLRGYRIEPGEIEAAILAYSGIAQAVAVLQTPADRTPILAGYYVPDDPGLPVDQVAMLKHLRTLLPAYEIPSVLVPLDRLPLTTNGKLDRDALPIAAFVQSESGGRTSPRNPVESLLSEIWAQTEVLGIEALDIHDNFFDLGGHSLLATRVMSRVRQTFDVEMPLRSLFEAPTIAAMAERVGLAMGGDSAAGEKKIEPSPRGGPLPLSYAQQRLWFLDQLDPGKASYNVPLVLRLEGELDVPAMRGAVEALIERHEILRTRFEMAEDEPVQIIGDASAFAWRELDLQSTSDPEYEARNFAMQESRRPFALDQGEVLRATLVRVGSDQAWLVLVLHHIVIDGWALGLLLHELNRHYKTARAGGQRDLTAPSLQYSDFAVWQRQWMESKSAARQLEYWTTQLAGITHFDLTSDRPRPAIRSQRGANLPIVLDEALTLGLHRLSRREGVTLFMTLIAAFQALLSRYADVQDIVVGTPVANRGRTEVEEMIGFFVNTLVLRADLGGEISVKTLLKRVRKMCLDAYAHQDLPFERLVEELHPERELSRSPIFSHLFALQNAPHTDAGIEGLATSFVPIDTGTAKFDLNVSLQEESGRISGTIEYSTDLWNEATIERISRHYLMMLQAMVDDAEQLIAEISLVSDQESALIARSNATQSPVSGDVVRCFEAAVKSAPGAVALIDAQESLTFAQLNVRANQLARHLGRLGVKAESRVGICLPRSCWQVTAMLAVLKTGAAYLPLDASNPPERLRFMAEGARVDAVVTNWSTRQDLGAAAQQEVFLDLEWQEIALEAEANLDVPIDGQQLAYVLYTSGSTGQPKGVMVPHAGLNNYLQWALLAYEHGGDQSVAHTSFSFDLTITALFVTLLAGRTVQLLGEESAVDILAQVLSSPGNLNHLKLTPAHLELLEHQLTGEGLVCRIGSLVIGGEALNQDALRFWRTHAPETRLINEYGPTEAVVGCCVYDAHEETVSAFGPAGPVPIGSPIANVRIHMLDDRLQRVPVGFPGELYIAGDSLARGYLDRPDLTAERFIPDPFTLTPGGRLYRSGDRARYLIGGQLEYLGRNDDQIKLRGYRVEPGEVEAVLRLHPDVARAAVILDQAGGAKRLVAYIVPAPESNPDPAAVRDFLRLHLPEYEVPAAIVALAELPLTANGKLDRSRLPSPEIVAGSPEEGRSMSAVETLVHDIWADVLGVPRLRADDNFFAIGGHSLLATRVISRMRQAFSIELPLRALFEAPTISGIAARVDAARGAVFTRTTQLTPARRDQPLPLSFAQQRLWFLDQLQPGEAAYNVQLALRLGGKLAAAALEAALNDLIARHEILRTCFVSRNEKPGQVVEPELTLSLRIVQFGAEAAPGSGSAAAIEEAGRPFDLTQAPLLRATLFTDAANDPLLLLVFHHAVIDGWSLAILARELSTCYTARVAGETPQLPTLPVQYADYAVWQRQTIDEKARARELQYWRTQLAELEPLPLATDFPPPPVQPRTGAIIEFTLPRHLSDALRRAARQEGATLFMTLLAGFQLLLARHTGSDDIAVGTPVANRGLTEIEGLIGFFVNTVVLRTRVDSGLSFRGLLRRVRTVCLDAFAHQELPFELLVDAIEPERDLSRSPLFQVMFALQDTSDSELRMAGIEAVYETVHNGTSKFPLNFNLADSGEDVVGLLEYSPEIFAAESMRQMIDHYKHLLTEAVHNLEAEVMQLPLLSDSERKDLDAWNSTQRTFAQNDLVALFELQVQTNPGRIAVRSGGVALTFTELNARSNQLARYLRCNGVSAETRVGIAIPRSDAMIISILAVLKAGGAYVPVDLSHPAERLLHLVSDAGIRLLLGGTIPSGITHDGLKEISLEDTWPRITREPAGDLGLTRHLEQLAYIVYTSGSTGWPKGAMVTHRGLGNYLNWAAERYGSEAAIDSVVHSPLSSDLTLTSLLLPLMLGGTVTLLRPDADAEGLADFLLGSSAASLLKVTPAHLQVLESRFGAVKTESALSATSVATMVIGGEALRYGSVAFWQASSPATHLINEYGPTETVVGCCVYEVKRSKERLLTSSSSSVPIGRPIANTKLYVLDPLLQPVPNGVPGEIYIAGDGVARGYVSAAGPTAEGFLPDPFAAAGARMYRTGDRARRRHDGELEYLGRLDHQVKLRGFRIELGEIEAAILAQPGVVQAAVLLQRLASGDRLAGFYAAAEGLVAPLPAAMKAALKLRLPEYEVPSFMLAVDRLPLTSSGKVDRKSLLTLAAAEEEQPVAESGRTPVETLLTEIWAQAEVLGVEHLGLHENFFELGGHSLLATRVISRVRQTFEVEMPLRSLFESPTIAGMAERVELALTGDQRATDPVTRIPRNAPLPLSYAQHRLWFLAKLSPESASYNVPFVWSLMGDLDQPALEQSLLELVQRHEVLRTRFITVDEVPFQLIDDSARFTVAAIDFSEQGIHAGAAAESWVQQEALRTFDLERGPVCRATIVTLGAGLHWLVLVMHHIVIDGWAVGVLLGELSALYSKHTGLDVRLPELPVQYADYAAWQRNWMSGPVPERQLEYWKEQLTSLTPLHLPTDHKRPAVQTFRGETVTFNFSMELSEGLRRLARREGSTLFMLLLAGFQLLMGRYSGSEDVVIGTPVANRNRAEIEGLIGFFVNTLVLRANLGGQPAFRELLRRVRKACLEAYAHQDLPFERLVEELHPERDLSRSPLFQVFFALQNAHNAHVELPGLTCQYLPVGTGTSKFDLNISMHESQGEISGTVEFNPDLFEDSTITRMVGHYENLLRSVTEDPEQNIGEIALMSASEQQQLASWNETIEETFAEDTFAAQTAVSLIEGQAALSPDAVALIAEGVSISFADLNERANRLAQTLLALGVAPDARVGLLLDRSVDLVVALLAVLKSGAAYVPLDPDYPARRLQYLVEDAGVTVLLTESKWEGKIAVASRMVLDREANRIAESSSANLARVILAEQLAYVVYTSGSTGEPKGAMITHAGLANYLHWAAKAYDVASGEGSIVHSSLSFDLTVTSLLVPLVAGRPVHLLPHGGEIDALADCVIQARGLSLLKLTPAHLEVLQQTLAGHELGGHVRTLVIGGEALYEPALEFWRLHAPGTRLINEYGPTEAVVGCCVFEAARERRDPRDSAGAVPIGKPIANTKMYVLDSTLQKNPVGVPGEIYIGGKGVARGYLGHPGLTAERFVPDPFAATPGGRLFRTGDRARYLADGNLEYLGRLDDQVKLRGYRLELGGVEAALLALPFIAQAAVVLEDRGEGDQRLAAFYTLGDTAEARASEYGSEQIRASLKLYLPDHEIPSIYVHLPAMPLTINGKIDRAALPAPDHVEATSGQTSARTETESLLSEIWAQAEILGVDSLGIHDNFFDLGGHSLLATRIISRVRQTFEIELPLRSIFEAPTVAQMARQVESARAAEHAKPDGPVRLARGVPMPLSYSQQRLWFLDQLEPGTAEYNVPLAVRLRGPVSSIAVEYSLRALAERQEVLRTRFVNIDGEPRQVVDDTSSPSLETLDFTPHPDAEAEAMLKARHEVGRAFDLARGPLLRATLIHIADNDNLLVFVMHHIVLDGWSVGILLREFNELYSAALLDQPATLPPLPVQYADFAVWQREWLSGEILEVQTAYWRKQLQSLERLDLPTDHARPAVRSVRGATEAFGFTSALSASLQRLGRRENATLFMTLLAGFQCLLARYSGSDDVAVGSPVANRNRSEIEGLLGFFVNTLVLRSDLSGQPDTHLLLERVRQMCLDAYAHQDLPFEKLVEELHPHRDLGRSPLFQVMFSLNDTSESEMSIGGLPTSFVPLHAGSSKFDLNLHLSEQNGNIAGILEYNSDLFEPGTIRRMLNHYFVLLEGMALDPDSPVAELPLLTLEERQQMLVLNQTEKAFDSAETVISLFEAQAAATPDALAVVSGANRISYGVLNGAANQLAASLHGMGIGAEDLIGIHLERSLAMVAALLGVLKAGAAYLPLDPSYPFERLRYMAADSGAQLVITSRLLRDEVWQGENLRCLVSDDFTDLIQVPPATNADAAPTPRIVADQLAYVIYTSGSTGRPKGTMISHGALANYVLAAAEYACPEEGTGSIVHSSLSFDLTITSLYLPLLAGKTIRLTAPRNDIEELTALLCSGDDLSMLKLTPAHLAVLEQNLAGVDLTGKVRALVIGGEALPETALPFWRASIPGVRLINEYGPTETTVGCCIYDASRLEVPCTAGAAEPAARRGVPIGRATANQQIHLIDRNLERVPIGIPGEIFIGGAGVARGYIGRPDLTAERFVPDPYGAKPGARLFRTGDRASYRGDGELDFLGRLDDQIKLRGYRIEPGQIEAAIRRFPSVLEAAVTLGGANRALIAYVSPRDGTSIDIANLRLHLKTLLPEYEIPSTIFVLDDIPLTANGKIDRKRLPASEPSLSAGASMADPEDAALALLTDIWAAVLESGRPSPQDNFFESGGHSLLATRLVSRIRQVFEVQLPVRALFETPTLAGIAERIEGLLRGGEVPVEPLTSVSRTSPLQLSFAQQRLWFLHQMKPDSAVYNIPFALDLQGELNLAALATALEQLTARHEVLRTVFDIEEDEPTQRVMPQAPVPVHVVDVAGDPEADTSLLLDGGSRALIEAEAQLPFNLGCGPVLRASVYRVGPARHILLLVMHHVVIDGWSFSILLRELGSLYEAARSGTDAILPVLTAQYADYAAWQRRTLQGPALDRQRAYWLRQLRHLEPLELPSDRPRGLLNTSTGAVSGIAFPASLTQSLRRLSRAQNSTLFITLLAAFKVLLMNACGREDIAVGTFVANRTHVAVEGLIGCFINTLVLRTDLSGDPSFSEVLNRVRKVCLDSYTHQDFPFEKLVEELQPERDLSRPPLFTVLFQVQNTPATTACLSDLVCETYPVGTSTSKYDLHIAISECDGVLAGALEYNNGLFDESTIERFKHRYIDLLEALLEDIEAPVSSFSVCAEAELRLIEQWNPAGALRDNLAAGSLVSRFEKQARRTPNTIALIQGKRQLSFAELNRRANQLARHLQQLGTAAESRIGISLERSCELVIALMGILKAGAAYVPLDPENPAPRLEAMTREAGVAIVITNRQYRRASWAGIEQVLVDGDAATIAKLATANLALVIQPSRLLYVMFTSGSTGTPKGVMGTHAATLNRLDWMYAAYPFAEGEVCCTKASINFVDSVWEIFGPLLAGVPNVLIPATDSYDPADFLNTLQSHRVTRLVLVPSLLEMLLENGPRHALAMSSVQYWITSGEALTGKLAQELLNAVPSSRLLNLYGASENAADVTLFEVARNTADAWVPLGRPIAATHIYVLDAQMRAVGIGVPGEIYVAGAGIARGYIGSPQFTAERFVPNPFAEIRGGRMYRTGDIGRFREDGTILFEGRADHQVKIRGRRIELGDISNAIESLPGVARAVVTVTTHEEDASNKRLIAYIVAEAEAVGSELLRERLKKILPAYMVPEQFIAMDALPLTISGKLDRRALPKPPRTMPWAQPEDAAIPRSHAEQKITDIWKKYLKLDFIGLDENFFDVGGHSLQVVKVARELQRSFHRDVSVLDLFTRPTIRSLASLFGPRSEEVFAVETIQRRSRLRSAFYQQVQHEVQEEMQP